MSKNKAVEFSKDELKTLIEDKNSSVTVHKSFYNLALYPYHLTNITSSIKDILNAGVAKYDKKLDGILLGYKNVKILTPEGAIVTDSCYIHVDIEADFYIFKPEVGATLTGIVNKKSKDHVGCLVHRIFNVSVPNKSEDDAWPGYHVEIGEEVLLQVTYINLDARLPYIRTSFIVTNSKKKKKKKSKIIDEVDATFLNNEIQEFKLNKKDLNTSVTPPQSPKTKKKKKKSYEESNTEEVNDVAKITIESFTEVKAEKRKKRKSKENNNSLTNLNITAEEERINNVVNNTLNTSTEIKLHKKNKRKSKDNNESLTNLNITVEKERINNTLDTSTEIKLHKKNKRKSKDNNDSLTNLNITAEEERINNVVNNTLNTSTEIKLRKKNKRQSKDNNDSLTNLNTTVEKERINNTLNTSTEIKLHKKNKRKSKDNNQVSENVKIYEESKTIHNVSTDILNSTPDIKSGKKNKRKSKDKNDTSQKLNGSTIDETINNVANGIFSSTIKPESDKKEKRKSKINISTNELDVSKTASTKINDVNIDLQALRNSLLAEQLATLGQLETPKNSKKRKRKSDECTVNSETPIINSEEVRKSKKRKTSFSEHLSEDNLELQNSYADTTMDDSFKSPKKNKHLNSFDKAQFSETVIDSIIIAKSKKKRKHSISELDGSAMNKKKRKHSETDVHSESVNEVDTSPMKKKHKSKKNKHHDVEIDNC